MAFSPRESDLQRLVPDSEGDDETGHSDELELELQFRATSPRGPAARRWPWLGAAAPLVAGAALLAALLAAGAASAGRLRREGRQKSPIEAVQALYGARYGGYWVLPHTYCNDLYKLGPLLSGVDERGCARRCSADSRCRAYEMYRGGPGCTLLSRCAKRGASNIGTYVGLKEATGGYHYHDSAPWLARPAPGRPAAGPLAVQAAAKVTGIAPSPMPTPMPTPMPAPAPGPGGFDCQAGIANWEFGWSPAKKHWCCTYYYDGCPTGRPPSPTPSEPFDCQDGVSTWWESWSEPKKNWCCNSYYNGCPTTTAQSGYDCEKDVLEWEDMWSAAKQLWCCENHYVGCPPQPSTTWRASSQVPSTTTAYGATTSTPFETTLLGTGATSTTPYLGISTTAFGDTSLPVTSTTPYAGTSTTPAVIAAGSSTLPFGFTSTIPFPPKYDCSVALAGTESVSQRAWCCQNTGQFCTTTAAFAGTSTTPLAETTQLASSGTWDPLKNPYDCNEAYATWQSIWTTDKKKWCCEYVLRGCEEHHDSVAPGAPPTTSKVDPITDPWHCSKGDPISWPEAKKNWCNEYKGGFVSTPAAPTTFSSTTPFAVETTLVPLQKVWDPTKDVYDCQKGRELWKTMWSNEKKAWCCTYEMIGCIVTSPQVRITTTDYPAAVWTTFSFTTPFKHAPVRPQDVTTTPFTDPWTTFSFTTPFKHVPVRPQDVTTTPFTDPFRTTTQFFKRMYESKNCDEALSLVESEQCSAIELSATLSRTCPVRSEAAKNACLDWFGDMDGLPTEAQTLKLQTECVNQVKFSANVSEHIPYTTPANGQEADLCFSCTLKCYMPTPQKKCAETSVDRMKADGSSSHCKPTENGRIAGVQHRRRKEANDLTDAEWKSLSLAMNKLRLNGVYGEFARNFSKGMPMQDPEFMNFQNLPWYRRFIFDFETALQVAANDCDLTLPYWNANLDASRKSLWESSIWNANRLGGRPECSQGGFACRRPTVNGASACRTAAGKSTRWCLESGIANGWKVGPGRAENGGCECVNRNPDMQTALGSYGVVFGAIKALRTFKALTNTLVPLRAAFHCSVPGRDSTMCSDQVAAWDPLLWFVYADLDRYFFSWQRYHYLKNDIDTTDCYGCSMKLSHYHVPLKDWMGRHSEECGCILLPKANPVACVFYEGVANLQEIVDDHVPEVPKFNCAVGWDNWQLGWSSMKKTWCCKHKGKGCPSLPGYFPNKMPEFNCAAGYDHRQRGWSVKKKTWCCANRGKGCPERPVEPSKFDCAAGWDHWQRGWSVKKQVWCCQNRGKGCSNDIAELPKFDCAAGYDNWQRGWSAKKKSWCCQQLGKGCPTGYVKVL